jgi:hypothetical protein
MPREKLHENPRCTFHIVAWHLAERGNNVAGQVTIGTGADFFGMHRELQLEQFFLCAKLRTVRILRRSMHN